MMFASADDIEIIAFCIVFYVIPALMLVVFLRWLLKKGKKPHERAFVWCDFLVASVVIAAAACAPQSWNPSTSTILSILGGIFVAFCAVSLLTKKNIFKSFLWATLWFIGTVVTAGIVGILVHVRGPC